MLKPHLAVIDAVRRSFSSSGLSLSLSSPLKDGGAGAGDRECKSILSLQHSTSELDAKPRDQVSIVKTSWSSRNRASFGKTRVSPRLFKVAGGTNRYSKQTADRSIIKSHLASDDPKKGSINAQAIRFPLPDGSTKLAHARPDGKNEGEALGLSNAEVEDEVSLLSYIRKERGSSPAAARQTQELEDFDHFDNLENDPDQLSHHPTDTPPKRRKTERGTYAVTLAVTPPLHQTLTSLRHQHFPRNLNKQAAHICLFRRLPSSKLSRVAHELSSLAATIDSFPLRTAQRATRTPQGVILTFAHGAPAAAHLHRSLWRRWRPFLRHQPYKLDAALQFVPYVTLQSFVHDAALVDATLAAINTQLREIPARNPRASVADGGGALSGLATGLALFKVDERGGWVFVRRYGFRDVPTKGWDAPEGLTIPELRGVGGRDGLFHVPDRDKIALGVRSLNETD